MLLVPDSRGLERNFHDVTIVDMGDLPESSVSMDELSFSPPTMAAHGAPSYGMAAARPGYDACGGQETVP